MVALWNRADHCIFALLFLLSFFFFSSPNLSRRRLNVCHTCTHGVALAWISGAGLKCAARGSLQIKDAKSRQKSQSGHHRTTLSGISSQLRHVLTIGKKLVKQQYLLHMSSQYGELRPTSGWDLLANLRTPANFDACRVLAELLHGTLVVGVSQTLRRWTEGATYVRQGGHDVGHWPTFLVRFFSPSAKTCWSIQYEMYRVGGTWSMHGGGFAAPKCENWEFCAHFCCEGGFPCTTLTTFYRVYRMGLYTGIQILVLQRRLNATYWTLILLLFKRFWF